MAIAYVQKNGTYTTSGGSSFPLAFTSNNASGNLLVCTVLSTVATDTFALTDSQGNTWATAKTVSATSPFATSIGIFYAANSKAGANTVTVHTGTSTTAEIEIHLSEYSGVSKITPLDKTASASGSGTGTASSGPVTPIINGELCYGFNATTSASNGAGSGYTSLTNEDGDQTEYKVQTTATSTAATFSVSSGDSWVCLLATFLPVGASVTVSAKATVTPTANVIPTGSVAVNGVASVTTTLSSASAGTGSLSAVCNVSPTGLVNLTSLGTSDWACWGYSSDSSFDDDASGGSQISTLINIGPIYSYRYSGNSIQYGWSNGTPDSSVSSTDTGLYIPRAGNGYSFTAPADTTTRVLRVYMGAYQSNATVTATLSDGSASTYSSTALNDPNGTSTNGYFDFTYSAASSGQTLTVKSTGNSNNGNVTIQAAALWVSTTSGGASGSLSAVYNVSPTGLVNLTTLGTSDWACWGYSSDSSFDDDSSGGSQISNLTAFGPIYSYRYSGNSIQYGWSNGTPDASVSSTDTGLYIPGAGSGYKFTAPADTTTRVLRVYLGAYQSDATVTATLSDGSASSYTSTALQTPNAAANAYYDFTYAAGSSGQTLTVQCLGDSDAGNVTIQAAALWLSTTTVSGTATTTVSGAGSVLANGTSVSTCSCVGSGNVVATGTGLVFGAVSTTGTGVSLFAGTTPASVTCSCIGSSSFSGSDFVSATVSVSGIASSSFTGSTFVKGNVTSSGFASSAFNGSTFVLATVTSSGVSSSSFTGSDIVKANVTSAGNAFTSFVGLTFVSATASTSGTATVTASSTLFVSASCSAQVSDQPPPNSSSLLLSQAEAEHPARCLASSLRPPASRV